MKLKLLFSKESLELLSHTSAKSTTPFLFTRRCSKKIRVPFSSTACFTSGFCCLMFCTKESQPWMGLGRFDWCHQSVCFLRITGGFGAQKACWGRKNDRIDIHPHNNRLVAMALFEIINGSRYIRGYLTLLCKVNCGRHEKKGAKEILHPFFTGMA